MKQQKLCPVDHLLQLSEDLVAVSVREALMQNSLHLSDSQESNCCNELLQGSGRGRCCRGPRDWESPPCGHLLELHLGVFALFGQVVDLLNVLVQLLVLVCWHGLLEVGDPGFDGGHARRGLLSTLLDDVVGLLEQRFVLLLLVSALSSTS